MPCHSEAASGALRWQRQEQHYRLLTHRLGYKPTLLREIGAAPRIRNAPAADQKTFFAVSSSEMRSIVTRLRASGCGGSTMRALTFSPRQS